MRCVISSLGWKASTIFGQPDPLVDVFALQPKETPEQAIVRIDLAHTDPKSAAKCVL